MNFTLLKSHLNLNSPSIHKISDAVHLHVSECRPQILIRFLYKPIPVWSPLWHRENQSPQRQNPPSLISSETRENVTTLGPPHTTSLRTKAGFDIQAAVKYETWKGGLWTRGAHLYSVPVSFHEHPHTRRLWGTDVDTGQGGSKHALPRNRPFKWVGHRFLYQYIEPQSNRHLCVSDRPLRRKLYNMRTTVRAPHLFLHTEEEHPRWQFPGPMSMGYTGNERRELN